MEIEQYIGHKVPVLPIEDSMLAEPAPKAKIERRSNGQGRRQGKGQSRKPRSANAESSQKSEGNGEKKPARRRRRRKPANKTASDQIGNENKPD